VLNYKKTITLSALYLLSSSIGFAIEGYFSQDANIHPLNITLYGNHFKDKLLEEVKNFDGKTYGANLNVPLNDYNQIQINYPFRTTGKADSTKKLFYGQRIDIHGNGGVYEYATIGLDHKFTNKQNTDYSVLGFFRAGHRAAALDNDLQDKINHRGRLIGGGFRAENTFDNGIKALTNVTLDFYNDTDDLTYSDKVSFLAGDFDLLLTHTYASILSIIQPYVELRAFSDFNKYNTYYAEAGLFANIFKFDLVAGYIKGLNNKADDNIIGLKIRANSNLL
tara:strand:+ start:11951 stop:12787 length:837 start_codon:yes stop_codon:yes gene_type:complete